MYLLVSPIEYKSRASTICGRDFKIRETQVYIRKSSTAGQDLGGLLLAGAAGLFLPTHIT
jgi:hypothetical protein